MSKVNASKPSANKPGAATNKPKAKKGSKEVEIEIKCDYDYVIISRPDGTETLSRCVPMSYVDSVMHKNVEIKDSSMPRIEVSVDFKKHIAWSHNIDDAVRDVSKQFSQKYFGMDMEF